MTTTDASSGRCPRLCPLALIVMLFAAGGCRLVPAPSQPCPPLPLAAALLGRAVATPRLESLAETAPGRCDGVLAGDGEQVRFQLRAPGPGERRGRVLLVPILAGGEDLMDQVAQRLVARGFGVAFCARVAPALKPPQRGRDLDELFQRTVLHQRLLLAFLREREPGVATFVLGISMGGIVSTILTALEPGVEGVAICLSGGDLGDLIGHSSERRVREWRAWRHTTDGVGEDHLRWELQHVLRYEPIAFAPAIPTEKVLFVSAALDTVVPRNNQDVLWEALGRPARLDLLLGHYSAALAIDAILTAAAEHFDRRARLALGGPRDPGGGGGGDPAVTGAAGGTAEAR